MKLIQLSIFTFFLLFSGSLVAQTTWYVDVSSGDNNINDGQSESSPFATIFKAVGEAADNDIIKVAAGTYTHSNIWIDKNLSIEGQDGDANAVIIQAQANEPDYSGTGTSANNRIFTLAGTANLSLKNLTIRYGNNADAGGAIIVYAGQSISIDRCNILNCYSENNGGAIASWGSINITNSCIANNIAGGTRGGAIMGYSKQANQLNEITINNSVIYNNATTASDNNGGGCAIFSDNSNADYGTVEINNSTLAYNHILSPSTGTKTVGIRFSKGKYLHLTNSILFNSTNNLSSSGLEISSTVSDIIDITKRGTNHHNIISFAWNLGIGTDCISKENATANHIKFGTFIKGTNGVYTLPILSGSVAIDAADASTTIATDMIGTSRGSAPDIGAFEFTTPTTIRESSVEMSIAPNPNYGSFTVMTEAGNGCLEVFSMTGQKLYSSPIKAGSNLIELPAVIKGLTIVKINCNGQIATRKIIIK
ncbi:T9SS type A sorting domain-containing protein [Carboxylicivirga marina]|uniref:T9SS type A sorting domain-containing protein n=1 Tax=Carboxylicivirga marina TaxID=2800988 RepID=A0ABS1HHE5_9BACT|nr:T9SS type A sorting domain-containing protein [Carboxylicivirga marina]MBK3517103.1 T9SS type A sorting domain-containing protein [Carboxylicivirga marina]